MNTQGVENSTYHDVDASKGEIIINESHSAVVLNTVVISFASSVVRDSFKSKAVGVLLHNMNARCVVALTQMCGCASNFLGRIVSVLVFTAVKL